MWFSLFPFSITNKLKHYRASIILSRLWFKTTSSCKLLHMQPNKQIQTCIHGSSVNHFHCDIWRPPHRLHPLPLCLCPPNPVCKDPLPPLLQHPTFLSRPPTLTTDDESTTRFTVTFQNTSSLSSILVSLPPPPTPPHPTPFSVNMSAGQGSHSVHIDSSSVQFKGEVWELSLQQRAHNWHPSCLIKGESTEMDLLSQISAFIRIVCKQSHTQRRLKALLIAVF